jgi:hypothetical protein
MLDALKRKMGISPTAKEVKMKNPADAVVELAVNVTELPAFTELTAAFASQAETLAAVVEELAQAKFALAAVQEAKELALSQAKKIKMDARRVTVEASIGTAKADAFLSATEALDDTAFASVASALAGSVEAEANTALFTEVGVTGEATPESLPEAKSQEMKILEAKYKAAKPAK